MNFQFYCPKGHLLQANDAHAGSVIACPVCSIQFIIPSPPPQAEPVVTPVVTPVVDHSENALSNLDFTPSAQNQAGSGEKFFNTFPNVESNGKAKNQSDAPANANPFDMMKQKKEKEQKIQNAAMTKEMLAQAVKAPPKAAELELLHIPCPKGHVLDVDKEMLGQRVQCPVCRSVYDLMLENSLEFIQEKKKERELEELRLGKVWIVWAIVGLILLVLFLLFLLFT